MLEFFLRLWYTFQYTAKSETCVETVYALAYTESRGGCVSVDGYWVCGLCGACPLVCDGRSVMSMHEIVVGNIGTVYCGESAEEARVRFTRYCERASVSYGRAAGESVTWLCDGEIWLECHGTVQDE